MSMAKNWYNYWLEPEENHGSHNSKAAKARRNMKKEAEARGYPKSGDRYQKKAASNNYSNSAANRGYPQSGDSYQKQAAANTTSTSQNTNVRKTLQDAFKKKVTKK